jgi:hypothetical protein
MVKFSFPRLRSLVIGGLLIWVAVSNPGVRRQVLSTVGTATRVVYQTAVNRLQSEATIFDHESQAQDARLDALRRARELATSEAERLAIDNEIRDVESHRIAALNDRGQVVRSAREIEQTGDGIAEAWRVARGYANPTRNSLIADRDAARQQGRDAVAQSQAQQAELDAARNAQAAAVNQLTSVEEQLRQTRIELEAQKPASSAGCPSAKPAEGSQRYQVVVQPAQ